MVHNPLETLPDNPTKAIGLHLELFDIPMYENIKLSWEVEAYLKTKNFELKWSSKPFGTFNAARDHLFVHKQRCTPNCYHYIKY